MAIIVLTDVNISAFLNLKVLRFGNFHELDTNINNSETLARDAIVSKDPTWPNYNSFSFSFTTVTNTVIEQFKTFIETFPGQAIWLYDTTEPLPAVWRFGFIIEDSISISTDRDGCSHSVGFTFLEIENEPGEGETVPPIPPGVPGAVTGMYVVGFGSNPVEQFINTPGAGGGNWITMTDYPSPNRQRATGSPLKGKGYIIGGADFGGGGDLLKDTSVYSPPIAGVGGGSWSSASDLPSPARSSASSNFNPQQGAIFVFAGSPALPIPGFEAFANVGNESFIFGGSTFSVINTLPFFQGVPPRALHTSVALNVGDVDKNYIFGGKGGLSSGLDDVQEHDPESDTYVTKAPIINVHRFGHASVELGNKGYVIAGQTDFVTLTTDVDQYTPALLGPGTWVDIGGIPAAKGSTVVASVLDGKVIVTGGVSPGLITTYEFGLGPLTALTVITKISDLRSIETDTAFTLTS